MEFYLQFILSETCMRKLTFVLLTSASIVFTSQFPSKDLTIISGPQSIENATSITHREGTWQYFLKHLPVLKAPIKDYMGNSVPDQEKAIGILTYDVGNRDLQQCADALIRLRAEYLFAQKQYGTISFQFTNGQLYAYQQYCAGLRPVMRNGKLSFAKGVNCAVNHASLRAYLDIVYTYAGTISLHRELLTTDKLEIGTVIISPGSPGHCCMIVDEALNEQGEIVYRLAESFTPAQSIYILRNPRDPKGGPWYRLGKGTINTASYNFTKYTLRKFE